MTIRSPEEYMQAQTALAKAIKEYNTALEIELLGAIADYAEYLIEEF